MNRNLDGVFFKIKRGGIWENICFSDLTDTEKLEVMMNMDTTWLKSLCIILGNRIKDIGDKLDIVAK